MFDAASTLLDWNPRFAVLLGDPAPLRGRERNVLWPHFTGRPGRVRLDAAQRERFEETAVAELRAATAHHPADPQLSGLIAQLRAAGGRFARLWEAHAVGAHTRAAQTVDHPEVGPSRSTATCRPRPTAGRGWWCTRRLRVAKRPRS